MKSKLWTKDFKLIISATALSIIAGEGMGIPISLIVFEKTQSTLLASFIIIISFIPDVLLSVLVAPLADKFSKKKGLIFLDSIMGILYLVIAYVFSITEFNLILYYVFTFLFSTISVFYSSFYNSYYPLLITKGLEQKGYAVGAILYPTVIAISAPLATFAYKYFTMSNICLIVAGITFTSVLIESFLTDKRTANKDKYTLNQYIIDLKDGFKYLKKEKGVRNIYAYVGVTNGVSIGNYPVIQAFFQSSPTLTVVMLGFLTTAETIGRVIGGFIQYTKEIPIKKRYRFTVFVYSFYDIMDSIQLFLPYPAMIVTKFMTGFLGSNSSTIRQAAMQSYLPDEKRARINSFQTVYVSISALVLTFIIGLLGEYLRYQYVILVSSLFSLNAMILLIVVAKKHTKKIYEATRLDV